MLEAIAKIEVEVLLLLEVVGDVLMRVEEGDEEGYMAVLPEGAREYMDAYICVSTYEMCSVHQ